MRKLFRGLPITLALLLTGAVAGVVVLNYYLEFSREQLGRPIRAVAPKQGRFHFAVLCQRSVRDIIAGPYTQIVDNRYSIIPAWIAR